MARRVEITYFIQENRPFVCHFETSDTVCGSIGKSSFLVPEHFTFEQALRNTSKIHFHKGVFGSLTVDMNGLGYQFLTCSAFPCNTLCSAFGLGVILYELGERLPIWNNYIGGGLLMAFFGTALLKFFNIIPEKTLENINRVISGDDVNLLEVYIIFLIAGSVLALDKDILLKSFVGYIPAILGGLAVATLFGVLAGLAVGVDPQTTIMKYVLPIMGGGNGAGAVPLSNIYETVTGDAAANFYGFAIIILTIGNIFAIIGSALLNTLGEKFSLPDRRQKDHRSRR